MPFQLAYTDENTKAHYPDAYWDFVCFGVEKNTKLLYVGFAGWVNKAAHLAGGAPIPGLELRVNLRDADYVATMKRAEAEGGLVTKIADMIDQIATEVKNVQTGVDEEGRPVMVSFFKDAQRSEPDLSTLV